MLYCYSLTTMYFKLFFRIRHKKFVDSICKFFLNTTVKIMPLGFSLTRSTRHSATGLSSRTRPLGSSVIEYSHLRQHGLTLTSREDLSGNWALETLYHTKITTSPQDAAYHISGPVMSNVIDTQYVYLQ